MRIILATLVIVLALSACEGEPTAFEPPTLVPNDVVSAANGFLEEKGINIAEYQLESLGFNYIKRTWHLQLEGKSGVLHDYYFVKIEDDNINEISLTGR